MGYVLGRHEGDFCPHFHTTYTIYYYIKRKRKRCIPCWWIWWHTLSLPPLYWKSCLQHLNRLETSKCLPQLPGLCILPLINPGGHRSPYFEKFQWAGESQLYKDCVMLINQSQVLLCYIIHTTNSQARQPDFHVWCKARVYLFDIFCWVAHSWLHQDLTTLFNWWIPKDV